MEKQKIPTIKEFKKVERTLELFKDDLSGYAQFIERNIRQSKEIVELENKIKEFLDIYLKQYPLRPEHNRKDYPGLARIVCRWQ